MHCSSKGSLFDHLVCTGLQCRRHVEAKRLGKLPTHHRIIACADERRSETLSGVQGSGEMYSVAIASRFSAAARTKTIVNSVAHMVDAPVSPVLIWKLLANYSKNTRPTLIPAACFQRLAICGLIATELDDSNWSDGLSRCLLLFLK